MFANNMNKSIPLKDGWAQVLGEEYIKNYMRKLKVFIIYEKKFKNIRPLSKNIFLSFNVTFLYDVRVVILGQDPYPGENQAHGLSFSVLPGVKIPMSLKNIYNELYNDLGIIPSNNGCLLKWAMQGVLLLNSVLTVEQGKPGSHRNKGWEIFTDKVIQVLSNLDRKIIFVLWGNYAREKIKFIDCNKNIIISSSHPSPLSVHKGFFGSKPFSQVNNYLIQMGSKPIDWKIDRL